jgi:hypothetical protein
MGEEAEENPDWLHSVKPGRQWPSGRWEGGWNPTEQMLCFPLLVKVTCDSTPLLNSSLALYESCHLPRCDS